MPVHVAREHGIGPTGVGVLNVVSGRPAALAGLRVGDIIVAIDKIPVGSVDDLLRFLSRAKPSAALSLGVVRGGQHLRLNVTLVAVAA